MYVREEESIVQYTELYFRILDIKVHAFNLDKKKKNKNTKTKINYEYACNYC